MQLVLAIEYLIKKDMKVMKEKYENVIELCH